MTFIEAPEDIPRTHNIPEDHLQLCEGQGIATAGNAVGNQDDLFDLTGANVSPPPLPEGSVGSNGASERMFRTALTNDPLVVDSHPGASSPSRSASSARSSASPSFLGQFFLVTTVLGFLFFYGCWGGGGAFLFERKTCNQR